MQPASTTSALTHTWISSRESPGSCRVYHVPVRVLLDELRQQQQLGFRTVVITAGRYAVHRPNFTLTAVVAGASTTVQVLMLYNLYSVPSDPVLFHKRFDPNKHSRSRQ